jgi:hypothetical protein
VTFPIAPHHIVPIECIQYVGVFGSGTNKQPANTQTKSLRHSRVKKGGSRLMSFRGENVVIVVLIGFSQESHRYRI